VKPYCCPNCDRPIWTLLALVLKRFWAWVLKVYRNEPEPSTWELVFEDEGYLSRRKREKREDTVSALAIEGHTVFFSYSDGDGFDTERVVDLQEVKSWGYKHGFKGFCHLRQEDRSFRTDRVKWLRVKPRAPVVIQTEPTAGGNWKQMTGRADRGPDDPGRVFRVHEEACDACRGVRDRGPNLTDRRCDEGVKLSAAYLQWKMRVK